MVKTILQQINNLGKKGFFHILVGGTLTKVIAFFASILIVRFVTKAEYAYLSYADNIYSYLYLIAGLGLDSAVLKYCVSDDKRKNKGYFSFALKVGAIWSTILLIAVICLTFLIQIPFPEARVYMISLVLYPLLYYTLCILQAFMRSRLKNKEFAFAGIIQTSIVLLISVGLVFKIGAFSVVAARYIAAVVVIIFCVWVVKDELVGDNYILDNFEKKEFIRFGISILIANVFSMIMPINEVFLVNNLLQDTVITANYKVANLIPQQLPFITSSIITFYFPYFARMTNGTEIWKKAKKVGLVSCLIIVISASIGIAISPFIIHIAYGDKYSDINLLMSSLWIMHGINAGVRMLPMNILPAIGHTKFNAIMAIVACVVHFAVDYYCIKCFGVKGAVLAGGIVYSITAAAYWVYLKRVTVLLKGGQLQ